MSTLSAKRQTYLNVIARLQEAHDASDDEGIREWLARGIALEKRLLARLDEVKKK